MEWCKLYGSLQHDKDLRRAGERATLLFVFGLCHCAEEETDGYIAEDVLPDFRLPGADARAASLVRVGVWDRVSDGYVIPGWREKQKELYAIMEKRRKDADRMRRKRKESRDGSYDSRATGREKVALESRERTTPLTPGKPGGSICAKHPDEPGADCRGCGTNRRAVQRAARIAAVPDWCGSCDEDTRLVELDDGRVGRCPRCNPNVVRSA